MEAMLKKINQRHKKISYFILHLQKQLINLKRHSSFQQGS